MSRRQRRRRSVMVTSNLVFSQWDPIFRDQMATAAAIDRLVHHAVVIEFDVPSYRTDRSRRKSPPAPAPRGPCSRSAAAPGPPTVDLVNVWPIPGAEFPFPGPLRNGVE